MPTSTRQGLLLVGHGTRDAGGRREFSELAAQVRARQPERIVEAAFLELAEPTIDDAVGQLVSQGVASCAVMPLLLFAAGHAKHDIPEAVKRAVRDAPWRWWQTPHLGCHPKILELSERRMHEVLAQHNLTPAEDCLLLLVGRGSTDDSATAEMHQFAKLRQQHGKLGCVMTCFYAMAQPSLAETLAQVTAMDLRRIIVQPHLLFAGDVLNRIREQVHSVSQQNPSQQWLIANHLGPNELLADAVVDIAPSRIENTI